MLKDWVNANNDQTLRDRIFRFTFERGVMFSSREYFEQLCRLRATTFKIQSWDAGWWQLRGALGERGMGAQALAKLKEAHDALGSKLAPAVEAFGFVR